MSVPYLQELTIRLAMGAGQLDPALRERHAQWLRKQQSSDGGFAGREGESDPYYTAFALRGLWVLGELDAETGASAARFLRSRLSARESIIDMISLIFAAAICEMAVGEIVLRDDDMAWRQNVAALLASLRTDDGEMTLSLGETVLIPASHGSVECEVAANSCLLEMQPRE